MFSPISILLQVRALCKIQNFIKCSVKTHRMMLPGVYKIHWSEKPILYNIENPSVITNCPTVYPDFLTRFFSKEIVIKTCEPSFRGEYALCSLNNEMKVFSTEGREVLSLLSREKQILLQLAAERMKSLNLTFLRITDCGVIDRWIDCSLGGALSQSNELYLRFLDDYGKYVKETPVLDNRSMRYYLERRLTRNKEIENIFGRLSKYLFNENFPVIYSHCDMHLGNMLKECETVWYIDYEYARHEIFLYDVFIGMVVAFWDESDSSLLNAYLQKDNVFISKIKYIFDAVGCCFEEVCLKKYLYAFLAVRLFFDINNGKKRFGKINYARYLKYLAEKNNRIIRYIEDFHD